MNSSNVGKGPWARTRVRVLLPIVFTRVLFSRQVFDDEFTWEDQDPKVTPLLFNVRRMKESRVVMVVVDCRSSSWSHGERDWF